MKNMKKIVMWHIIFSSNPMMNDIIFFMSNMTLSNDPRHRIIQDYQQYSPLSIHNRYPHHIVI